MRVSVSSCRFTNCVGRQGFNFLSCGVASVGGPKLLPQMTTKVVFVNPPPLSRRAHRFKFSNVHIAFVSVEPSAAVPTARRKRNDVIAHWWSLLSALHVSAPVH